MGFPDCNYLATHSHQVYSLAFLRVQSIPFLSLELGHLDLLHFCALLRMPLVLNNSVPEPRDFLHPQKLQMHGIFFVYLFAPHDASKGDEWDRDTAALLGAWGPEENSRTMDETCRGVGLAPRCSTSLYTTVGVK